jgi:hypothetical protein
VTSRSIQSRSPTISHLHTCCLLRIRGDAVVGTAAGSDRILDGAFRIVLHLTEDECGRLSVSMVSVDTLKA